jgi:predicted amidohydrolase
MSRAIHVLFAFLLIAFASALRAESPATTSAPAETQQKPATVKVAAIQFRSEFNNPDDNRKRLDPLIREAAKNGAKIVVLPETAITGYTSEDFLTIWHLDGWPIDKRFKGIDPTKSADTVPGTSTEMFSKLAGELGIYLTIPFVERVGEEKDAKFFNTICLADPKGKIVLHYRKLNPWPYPEQSWTTKGDRGHQVIDTEYGRLGLLVCFDINYEPPALKKLKVDTLLYCIAWVDGEKSTWFKKELPAIAKENNINIIGANWTIAKPTDWFGYGKSLILTREGVALTRCKDDLKEEILYAELPLK